MARHRSLSCNLNLEKDIAIVDFVNKKNQIGIRDASIVREAVKFYMEYYDNMKEIIYAHNALVASNIDASREVAIQQEIEEVILDSNRLVSKDIIGNDKGIANLLRMRSK